MSSEATDADPQFARTPISKASDPLTQSQDLLRLVTQRSSGPEEQAVLRAIAKNPTADRRALLAVLAEVRARLSRPNQRPYSVALQLMLRHELGADEVFALQHLPGASALFRRQLQQRYRERGMSSAELDRRDAVQDLVTLRLPIQDAVTSLRRFGWDSNELIVLTAQQMGPTFRDSLTEHWARPNSQLGPKRSRAATTSASTMERPKH